MPLLSIQNCQALIADHFSLSIETLNINAKQHTVIVGENGSGKSALAALIAGEGELLTGQRNIDAKIAWVCVEQQQALIEAEKQKDCADILDIIPTPTSCEAILFADLEQSAIDQQLIQKVNNTFGLTKLMPRAFRALSTGETKKLLLAKAIISQADLLILDEPWDGLDQQTIQDLNALLLDISSHVTIVVIINRLSETPSFCQQLILLKSASIQWQTQVNQDLALQLVHVKQLLHLQQQHLVVPIKDHDIFAPQPLDSNKALVTLRNAKVQYGDNIVFQHLNWTVKPQQHWQVTGANGSGKTCLLNLITGDHPQCYNNDINVFGFQRGTGESIWEIKQYIGYLSNGLHLDYRVNCTLLDVVLSGFYDSIGLYKKATKNQTLLALQWLTLMGLEDQAATPFQTLSFGDQRLLLIARAMVKHPALLILDEPCNGLDDINRLKVLALIDVLASDGSTTLLYVNHHQEDVIPSITEHLSMANFKVTD